MTWGRRITRGMGVLLVMLGVWLAANGFPLWLVTVVAFSVLVVLSVPDVPGTRAREECATGWPPACGHPAGISPVGERPGNCARGAMVAGDFATARLLAVLEAAKSSIEDFAEVHDEAAGWISEMKSDLGVISGRVERLGLALEGSDG